MSLDTPSRLDGEADLIRVLADDLDGNDGDIGNSVARVTAVGDARSMNGKKGREVFKS